MPKSFLHFTGNTENAVVYIDGGVGIVLDSSSASDNNENGQKNSIGQVLYEISPGKHDIVVENQMKLLCIEKYYWETGLQRRFKYHEKYHDIAYWFISIISFVGCAQKQMYYFGDYSKTLYCVSKDNNAEARTNHQQQLEEIISESKTNNFSGPPRYLCGAGVYQSKIRKKQRSHKTFSDGNGSVSGVQTLYGQTHQQSGS